MKTKHKSIIIGLGVLFAATTAYAVSASAGTIEDPLVTKSYVDMKVQEASGGVSPDVSHLQEQIQYQQELINELTTKIDNMANNTYQIVTVPQGKELIGGQGTEFVIRQGTAKVIAAEGGGLQDMTAGQDIAGGQEVPGYHLVMIPREDGRGISAQTELIVMVRGSYEIR